MVRGHAQSTHMFALRTIPLLRLFPGRPNKIFSCLTSFLGGIFFLLLAYERRALTPSCV